MKNIEEIKEKIAFAFDELLSIHEDAETMLTNSEYKKLDAVIGKLENLQIELAAKYKGGE